MHADMRKVRKKETIYVPGDVEDTIYMLCEGAVKLNKTTSRGETLITDILGKKALFGGISDAETSVRNEWAVALKDGLVYRLGRKELFRIHETDPKLASRMKALMEERRRRREDRLVAFAFHTVQQRFAEALLDLVNDFGSRHQGQYRLELLLTHETYAEFVASTRETVTTVFNRLRKNGIIDYKGRSVTVPSIDRLKEIARFKSIPGMVE